MLSEQEKLKRKYESEWNDVYGVHKCTCFVCGTVFYTKLERGKYCSYRCRNDGYIMRRKQRHEQALIKKCSVCGIEFKAKRTDAKYCSCACKQSAYRKAHVTDKGLSEI